MPDVIAIVESLLAFYEAPPTVDAGPVTLSAGEVALVARLHRVRERAVSLVRAGAR